MANNRTLFTRIVMMLAPNPSLTIEGAFDSAEVSPLIDRWVELLDQGASAEQEAAMAAQLKEANDKLKAAIDANP